ncbi:MAG: MFS transporter [Alicyclobacillus sp.]|nr:MFS transporter [Alicyclobacillus sp.]
MTQRGGMRQIFTRTKLLALVNLGLTEFVRGSLLFFILPIYIHGILHLPEGVVGYAMAAHYALDTCLRGPSGWLADRLGQRKVAVTALGIGWVGLWLLVRVHSDWAVILGCGLLGVGMAAIWPCVVARVTAGLPSAANATAMAGVMMAWLVGVGSGTVVMSVALGRRVVGGFAALLAVWLLCIAIAGVCLTGYRREDHEREHLGWRAFVRSISFIRLLVPGIFIQTFIMGILMPVFVLYTQYVIGLPAESYSLLLVTGGAVAVVLQLPVGRLVDRFSYKPFLLAGFGVCGLFLVWLGRVHTMPLLFAAIAGVGAGYALILPAWNSVLVHSIDAHRRTLMWGLFMTVEGLGMACGPLVGARLMQDFQPSTPFLVAGCVLFAMLLFYAYAPVERRFSGSAHSKQG